MPIGGPFDSVKGFWGSHAVPLGAASAAPPSKGALLGILEGLIREAQGEQKAFVEGRTTFIGYVENMRGRMQRYLVDAGESAQAELRELATMDLSISDELARWYAKGVYN